MKHKYQLEIHRTLEYVITKTDELGLRIVVTKCHDKTMAENIQELLNKYQRPSEKKAHG